jgi:prophage regulatory protein
MKMVREVLRLPELKKATGFSTSSLYLKIREGKFPKGTKLDPEGRCVVWFADEVEKWQKAAIAAALKSNEAA